MNKKKKRLKNIISFVFAALVIAMIPMLQAKATDGDTQTQVMNRLGRTTARVNVRYGPGDGLYDIIVHNDERVTLDSDKEVLIVDDEVYEASGNLWYNIVFQWKGEEISGWATSSYIKVIATVTPTPTPSPTPEPATPTPSPEPTPSPTPTAVPATPTPMPTIDPSSGDFRFVWGMIAALVIIAIIAIALIYVKNKLVYSSARTQEMSQKMKRLKNINLAEEKEDILSTTMITRRKRPEVRIVDENDEDREYDPELIDSLFGEELPAVERVRQEPTRESDEKRALRNEINKLKPHDMVLHKYFGKGEVYDNSDVKLLEVRFGSDVRFLNKDSLVSKRLLVKLDDDMLAGRRK